MKLTMPYMLLWHPDNLVQAYELELSLAAGPSIQFRLDAASRVNYDAMSHVPILDVNSTRLLLPLVDVSIGGVTTQNSLVLQHVPGSADPVLFELTHAQ
ncbi:MAG: hypothetical protein GY859_03775, partial [Desulfobacterales bacterium]|nr:hypothetical protein [Desulfobacterales bacterium]